MKVVMLVGNGFNCQIASLISNLSVAQLPANILVNLNVLSRLDYCPDETYGLIKPDHSILLKEENIRVIKSFLHSADLESQPPTWKNQAKEYLAAQLQELIIGVGERFWRYQNQGGYRDIKKLFRYFGCHFAGLLEENRISKMHIATTNYDGLLDTLLTAPTGKAAFLFQDGFGNGKSAHLKELKPGRFNFLDRYLFHLHGSYKFQKREGETYKIAGNLKNDNPVIVFNNPEVKEHLIQQDKVLSAYFNQLLKDLKTFDRLIIYGNSLINEPHIKKAIYDHFNRPQTDLIICSLHPQEVEKEIKPYYSHRIHTVATRHITSEQALLDLFGQLFKDQLSLERPSPGG